MRVLYYARTCQEWIMWWRDLRCTCIMNYSRSMWPTVLLSMVFPSVNNISLSLIGTNAVNQFNVPVLWQLTLNMTRLFRVVNFIKIISLMSLTHNHINYNGYQRVLWDPNYLNWQENGKPLWWRWCSFHFYCTRRSC